MLRVSRLPIFGIRVCKWVKNSYIFHEYAAKRVELSRSGDNSNVQGAFESTKTNLAVVLVVRYIKVDK